MSTVTWMIAKYVLCICIIKICIHIINLVISVAPLNPNIISTISYS